MPPSKPRVVVAMSGGVDSSVTAAILKKEGYDVIGIMLRLWSEENTQSNRCCTPESIDDARNVAEILEIPFYVLDFKDIFKKQIVDYFIETYAQGMTPNPCPLCNRSIRFGKLLDEARSLGASLLATGHYGQIKKEGDQYQLWKGLDPTKDQSYVLYKLSQDQLSSLLLPLGGITKKEVRKMAEEFQLPVYNRPDSQDLCFLGDETYRDFLARHQQSMFKPGEIVDRKGKILGLHQGLPNYTVGQRKGLGISAPEPTYVLRLDTYKNQLVVGHKNECGQTELYAKEVHYLSEIPPEKPINVEVKIRYNFQAVKATLFPEPDQKLKLVFDHLVMDITPGQSAVFYQGDRLLGGGIIQPILQNP